MSPTRSTPGCSVAPATSSSERYEAQAARFADLVERAIALQEPVAREVGERCLQMLQNDGETFTEEYADCIARKFNMSAANDLLDSVLRRYEEVFLLQRHKPGV